MSAPRSSRSATTGTHTADARIHELTGPRTEDDWRMDAPFAQPDEITERYARTNGSDDLTNAGHDGGSESSASGVIALGNGGATRSPNGTHGPERKRDDLTNAGRDGAH